MALVSESFKFLTRRKLPIDIICKRNYSPKTKSHEQTFNIKYSYKLCVGVAAGSATALYLRWKYKSSHDQHSQQLSQRSNFNNVNPFSCLADFINIPKVEALHGSKRPNEDLVLKGLKLNHRERRFMKFASVEHQGQLYMTPQDFIESVTDSEPRPRLKRRVLQEHDLERFASETPALARGSPHMFRAIYDKEPQTGFRIAFNMFDTDGNERVDKEEFLVLLHLLTLAAFKDFKAWVSSVSKDLSIRSEQEVKATVQAVSDALLGAGAMSKRVLLEKIFSTARKDRLNRAMEGVAKSSAFKADDEVEDEVEDELQKSHAVDTTLLVHFFGKKGKQDLKYEEFKTFMENLQTEVLEIEFNEFSKGLPTISELDFAKILLRYTYLGSDQYEMYLERLLDRLPEEIGITFAEFKSFCQFLNTLDDFSIAMKMYTLADQPISQDEFHRAVKICTGQELSAHIVDTVFKIFDDDGDGQLSYKEFIAIMRNRLHRGFKKNPQSVKARLKHCMRENYYSQRKHPGF